MAVTKVSTSISFPVEILRAVDERRGYQSRSAWVVGVIQKEIEREARAKRDPLAGMVKRVDNMFKEE